jgi:hypothetical protein
LARKSDRRVFDLLSQPLSKPVLRSQVPQKRKQT